MLGAGTVVEVEKQRGEDAKVEVYEGSVAKVEGGSVAEVEKQQQQGGGACHWSRELSGMSPGVRFRLFTWIVEPRCGKTAFDFFQQILSLEKETLSFQGAPFLGRS